MPQMLFQILGNRLPRNQIDAAIRKRPLDQIRYCESSQNFGNPMTAMWKKNLLPLLVDSRPMSDGEPRFVLDVALRPPSAPPVPTHHSGFPRVDDSCVLHCPFVNLLREPRPTYPPDTAEEIQWSARATHSASRHIPLSAISRPYASRRRACGSCASVRVGRR